MVFQIIERLLPYVGAQSWKTSWMHNNLNIWARKFYVEKLTCTKAQNLENITEINSAWEGMEEDWKSKEGVILRGNIKVGDWSPWMIGKVWIDYLRNRKQLKISEQGNDINKGGMPLTYMAL